MTLIADVAPPDSSIETTFHLMMLAALAVPFVFGFLILTAAYIHRKRSQRAENAYDDA
jgi:hypothetical protein